ncbi:phage holin [Microbacterium sp. KNMS]
MSLPTQTPNRWVPRPELRAWLYAIGIALAAMLVGYGVFSAEQGELWVALLGAILGVTNAVAARNLPRDGGTEPPAAD